MVWVFLLPVEPLGQRELLSVDHPLNPGPAHEVLVRLADEVHWRREKMVPI